jgi:quercetin dioxygenase-like cupin family protein
VESAFIFPSKLNFNQNIHNIQKGVSAMKQLLSIITVLLAVIILSGISFAQDAVKVDPKHYKVEFENDQVRVLRITYAPGEKGNMHSHPEGIAVFLTDGNGRFTYPDGKTEDISFKSGTVVWIPALTHQPENTGDKPFELIQIEMKTK